MPTGLILVALEDIEAILPVRARLLGAGYEVVVVRDGAAAMAELHRVELDVALVALALPGRGGLDVLSAAHHLSPETEVVILAEAAELTTAMECIHRGAFDLLSTPLDLEAVLLTVARAMERRSLRATTALFRASQEILSIQDPAQLPATIVGLVARVLEADDVALSLAGADGQMRTRHSCSMTPETRGIAVTEVGDALANAVAALGEPVLLPEDLVSGRIPGVVVDRVRSCIVYPLRSGERRVGVLTLSRVSDNRPYRRVDLERTGVLASQALLAVENAALTHRMVEAERLATIGHLAAGVAHEINNPLTYVMASATDALERVTQLREQGDADADADAEPLSVTLQELEAALGDVCDGAHRIAAIARDLRALSRTESAARESVDVSSVIRAAQRVTASQLRGNATVTLDLLDGAIVVGDEGRLVQVFVNLLVNAVQAAEERRSVTIHLSTSRVDDRIVASVRDDGPGIAPDKIALVFRPFYSTKTTSRGTGLGLSLSQSIVAEHGGTIAVESELGHGATFVISLPASEPAAEPETAVCKTLGKTRAA